MVQIDFSYTVDIMKAATPYFDPRTRRTMDLFTKLFDLLGCYRNFLLPLEMASNESYNKKLDIEGLLTGIRPKLRERELPIVDQILGIFNAKRMFETYSTYMEMMKNMENFNSGGSDTDGNTNFDGFSVLNSFMNNNSNAGMNCNMNPDMFSVLNSFMNNNSSEDTNSDIDEKDNADSSSYMDSDKGKDFASYMDSDDNYDSSSYIDSDGNYKGDLEAETTTDNSSSGFNFSNFASLFGDMVSPEQASNFENLSMLLKNMSYDDNKDNKDNKDLGDIKDDNNDDVSNQ